MYLIVSSVKMAWWRSGDRNMSSSR